MNAKVSNNSKFVVVGAAVLVAAVGAYGLGRIYPPQGGGTAGTIAPANRYQVSQVSSADVTLGDTSVPQLMQTDAFEVMVKDANFRTLAASPSFQALAQQNPQALAVIARDPQAFAAVAKDPRAFEALVAD